MAEFTVDHIIEATGAKILQGSNDSIVFSGISTDTRTIMPGNLFIALTGERFDGNAFAQEAVNKGAAGLLVSSDKLMLSATIPVFLVSDTRKALMELACLHRQRFSIPVVAVTGSNGKTSTKDMISAILSSKYNVLKTQANYNNEIGLSLTLLNLTTEHDAAVVEMGMRARGEIAALAKIALPTIGVVTNVGETHMELLGSMENIATAKAELVEQLPESGFAILNADNHYVRNMKNRTAATVITYGIVQQADVRASNIILGEADTRFTCSYNEQDFELEIPAIGKHNVYNALAAISVGLQLGLTLPEIQKGLSTFQPGAMRFHVKQMEAYTVIDDAYNASPMSMFAAIDTMQQIAKGRKVAILGDMLELGTVAEAAHREVGKKLAAAKVEIVVTVGKLAALIAETAAECGVPITKACSTHDEAQAFLKLHLEPGDTVLIKGSRGMKMEKMLALF